MRRIASLALCAVIITGCSPNIETKQIIHKSIEVDGRDFSVRVNKIVGKPLIEVNVFNSSVPVFSSLVCERNIMRKAAEKIAPEACKKSYSVEETNFIEAL